MKIVKKLSSWSSMEQVVETCLHSTCMESYERPILCGRGDIRNESSVFIPLTRVDKSITDHPVASQSSQRAPRRQNADLSKFVRKIYGSNKNMTIFYKQFYEFAYLTRFRAKYDRDFHSFLKENIELCYEDIEVTIGTPTVVDPRDAG